MRVGLVCPSNMLYMPYVDNYVGILEENKIDYVIINWDRFRIEEISEFTYRDNKTGSQRNFLDYYKYYRFVLNLLDDSYCDKLIVFGLQMTFFLSGYLIRNYKDKYIIDIRDYNRILRFFNPNKVIRNSAFTVISSPWYKHWLPKNNNYIINHNTQVESLLKLDKPNLDNNLDRIKISYIGAPRDFKINTEFINALANSEFIDLYYHGQSSINNKITKYVSDRNIRNVIITGRYDWKDETRLYKEANLINVLRYNSNINNYTALPNRLYNAALYGKPMIALDETYLSEIIKTYNLGLVIKSFEEVETEICTYIKDFDIEKYNYGRNILFKQIIEQNYIFSNKLSRFLLNPLTCLDSRMLLY